jgi:hypothetical protein
MTGASPVSPGCAPAGPAQRPTSPTLRRLDAEFFLQTVSSPPDYKYPFTYLGEDKFAIQIISLPSFSPSSIKEHSKLEDLLFYTLKSKSLW